MTIWKRRKCMDTYHQMNRTAATKLKYLYRFFTADVSRRQLSNGSFLQIFTEIFTPRSFINPDYPSQYSKTKGPTFCLHSTTFG